jgi:hypothetical protein
MQQIQADFDQLMAGIRTELSNHMQKLDRLYQSYVLHQQQLPQIQISQYSLQIWNDSNSFVGICGQFNAAGLIHKAMNFPPMDYGICTFHNDEDMKKAIQILRNDLDQDQGIKWEQITHHPIPAFLVMSYARENTIFSGLTTLPEQLAQSAPVPQPVQEPKMTHSTGARSRETDDEDHSPDFYKEREFDPKTAIHISNISTKAIKRVEKAFSMSEVGCDNLVAVFPKPGKRAVAVFNSETAADCALRFQLPQAYSHWKLEPIATSSKQIPKSARAEREMMMMREINTRGTSPKSISPQPSNAKAQLQHAAQDHPSKSPLMDCYRLGSVGEASKDKHFKKKKVAFGSNIGSEEDRQSPVREVCNDNPYSYEARKAVFVSNISEELRRNLPKAFAHIGPVERIIPTSNRSAVVVFPEQRMARNALFHDMPTPFQALRVTEARDYQPRGFRTWRGGAQTVTASNLSSQDRTRDQLKGFRTWRGGAQTVTASNLSSQDRTRDVSSQRTDTRGRRSGPLITPETIKSDWDCSGRGMYVLGTKRLDRHLASLSPPLICQNVPADGNCGWWAAIRAGNLHFQHPQELKSYVLEFWKLNRAHILNAVCVHNVDSWTAQLESNLKTNGAFIDQPSWQILAWMLERDIVIWDVFRCTRTIVEGTRPWAINGSTQPILVAHRDDEKYWTYNAQFAKQQKSAGHFWGILPRLPGNEAESDSSRQ